MLLLIGISFLVVIGIIIILVCRNAMKKNGNLESVDLPKGCKEISGRIKCESAD